MRVLAIMCHPDDMEVSCGGTLIKYKKQGHEVIVCHAANGNMGHMEIMPDELGPLRIKEAKKAGELAGFEVITTDIGDLTMDSANKEQLKKIIRVIRYAKPDVIITHHPEDYCSDHVELSKLVFNASFSASVPHYIPELGPATPVTPVFYCVTGMSFNFAPTEYVDITNEIELKEQMLLCHESQLKWIKEHDGIDLLEIQHATTRARGLQCGVAYAEGYTQLIGDLRMRTYRILP